MLGSAHCVVIEEPGSRHHVVGEELGLVRCVVIDRRNLDPCNVWFVHHVIDAKCGRCTLWSIHCVV